MADRKTEIEEEKVKASRGDSEANAPVDPEGGMPKKRKGDQDDVDNADQKEPEKTPQGTNNVKESVSKMFDGEELSEDFKAKATTILEATIESRVSEIREQMEKEYEETLVSNVQEATTDIVEKLDSYLDIIADRWIKENAMQVESAFKVEMAESFLGGLHDLYAKHNLQVESSDLNKIAELEEAVETLKEKSNAAYEHLIEVKKENEELVKSKLISEVSEGLSLVEKEKLSGLTESFDFEDEETFKKKVSTLKEHFFAESVSVDADDTENLNESVEKKELNESTDNFVNNYAKSISSVSRY